MAAGAAQQRLTPTAQPWQRPRVQTAVVLAVVWARDWAEPPVVPEPEGSRVTALQRLRRLREQPVPEAEAVRVTARQV